MKRSSCAAVAAVSILVGCTRHTDAPADAAPASSASLAPASSSAPLASAAANDAPDAASPSSSAPPRHHPEPPSTIVEATRRPLESFTKEPSLAPHVAALKAHFGGPTPLVAQRIDLADANVAWLLSAPGKEPKPLVLVLDPAHALLWSKEHPVGGIEPPVGDVTFAPRRDGGVALFACDPPTRLVAGRMWTADGGPFADYHVLDIDDCDALSSLYWPGHGWLVVAASLDGARAQLLREAGTLAWPQTGLDVAQWDRGDRTRRGERPHLASVTSAKVRIVSRGTSVDVTAEGDVLRNN